MERRHRKLRGTHTPQHRAAPRTKQHPRIAHPISTPPRSTRQALAQNIVPHQELTSVAKSRSARGRAAGSYTSIRPTLASALARVVPR
jgi:hypothetical protein